MCSSDLGGDARPDGEGEVQQLMRHPDGRSLTHQGQPAQDDQGAQSQAAAAPGRPVLIRVDTRSGHGASNTAKRIESTAEVDAFLIHELHMAVH